MSTELAWVPSPKQRRAAHALADPRNLNNTVVAEKAGVTRITLSKYLKDPDFCSYVHELLPQFTDDMMIEAWKVLYQKAIVDQDTESLKLFFRLKKQLGEKVSFNFNQQNIYNYEQQLLASDRPVATHIPTGGRRALRIEAEDVDVEELEELF